MVRNPKLLAASSAVIMAILVIGGFFATSETGSARPADSEHIAAVRYSGGISALLPPPRRPEVAAVSALHLRPSWMRKHQSRNCLTAGAHFDLFCWTSTIFTR